MSKSLKQEQDELFTGLEDILPTDIELSYETRGKKTSSTRLKWSKEDRASMYQPISEETRKKLSEANKGIKHGPRSEETRKKLSEANKGIKHGPRSEETCKRISEGRKGIVFTEEHRKNLSLSNKGRIVNEETREKLREASIRNGNKPPISNPKGSKRDASFSKKLMKPIITELGVFGSVTEGVAFHKQASIPNAEKKLTKNLKEGTNGYRYITKEEYIMLTGKEI